MKFQLSQCPPGTLPLSYQRARGRGGGGGGGAPLISETTGLTCDQALFSFSKRECMRTAKIGPDLRLRLGRLG